MVWLDRLALAVLNMKPFLSIHDIVHIASSENENFRIEHNYGW